MTSWVWNLFGAIWACLQAEETVGKMMMIRPERMQKWRCEFKQWKDLHSPRLKR